eukprot:SAG11_NODE_2892_length_2863_cov_2.334298_3_plen_269_part_00
MASAHPYPGATTRRRGPAAARGAGSSDAAVALVCLQRASRLLHRRHPRLQGCAVVLLGALCSDTHRRHFKLAAWSLGVGACFLASACVPAFMLIVRSQNQAEIPAKARFVPPPPSPLALDPTAAHYPPPEDPSCCAICECLALESPSLPRKCWQHAPAPSFSPLLTCRVRVQLSLQQAGARGLTPRCCPRATRSATRASSTTSRSMGAVHSPMLVHFLLPTHAPSVSMLNYRIRCASMCKRTAVVCLRWCVAVISPAQLRKVHGLADS